MKKNVIKLNEEQLKNIIMQYVSSVLNEDSNGNGGRTVYFVCKENVAQDILQHGFRNELVYKTLFRASARSSAGCPSRRPCR